MNIKNHKIEQQLNLDIHIHKITSVIHMLPERIVCWWNLVFSYTVFDGF